MDRHTDEYTVIIYVYARDTQEVSVIKLQILRLNDDIPVSVGDSKLVL
jgi:hypothetical protein